MKQHNSNGQNYDIKSNSFRVSLTFTVNRVKHQPYQTLCKTASIVSILVEFSGVDIQGA